MKFVNIIERAVDFGSFRSRNNLVSFTMKVVLYILPALVLGHYTDITIQTMKVRNTFGKNALYYIVLQTLLNIITLYIFVLFLQDFTSEFQTTIAGGYFMVLYFGMQTNYIYMLKDYATSITTY